MRIIIFGYKGYIGSNLMDYFKEREVIGIGRSDTWPTFGKDDVIINCAASGWIPGRDDVWEAVNDNILLTKYILDASNGAKIIQFCSGFEYARPTHPYSRSKGLAADMLRDRAHLVYLYTVFGRCNQMWRFIPSLVRACKSGEQYTITAPYTTRDFVHIDWVMGGVDALLNEDTPSVKQFGSGRARTLMNVYGMLCTIAGKNFPNVKIDHTNRDAFRYYADTPCFPDTLFFDLKREWEK